MNRTELWNAAVFEFEKLQAATNPLYKLTQSQLVWNYLLAWGRAGGSHTQPWNINSPKRREQQKLFTQLGTLARTRSNIATIRRELDSDLNFTSGEYLQMAIGVIEKQEQRIRRRMGDLKNLKGGG